jgi:dTDP-4-amino-4,6-dideoxygalactose transaminase
MTTALAIDGGAPVRAERLPLHSAPYAQQTPDIEQIELPVTDRVAASLLRLPISAAFSDADCDDVVMACAKVFERVGAHA